MDDPAECFFCDKKEVAPSWPDLHIMGINVGKVCPACQAQQFKEVKHGQP